MSVKKSNNSLKDIKELIELMIKTKTEYVKVGTTEVRLSQLALIDDVRIKGDDDIMFRDEQNTSEKVVESEREIIPDLSTIQPEDSDDLLYYSVK